MSDEQTVSIVAFLVGIVASVIGFLVTMCVQYSRINAQEIKSELRSLAAERDSEVTEFLLKKHEQQIEEILQRIERPEKRGVSLPAQHKHTDYYPGYF